MNALSAPLLYKPGARTGLWSVLAAGILILSLLAAHHPAAAQSTYPITGYGEACADFEGSQACFDFELTFLVRGGDVSAVGFRQQEITQNGVTVQVTTNLVWLGTFQGGDGGTVSGTWAGESTMEMPGGESYSQTNEGTWEGTLYADGTGNGSWSGEILGQTGIWSISYPAEEFQAGLPPAPTSSLENTPAPATPQPSPEPTELQPTPTSSGPPAVSGGGSSEDQGDQAPAGTDPSLESDAAAAAGDPRSALAGGAAGTLLGGLLGYLAARGSDLTDSGAKLPSDLQNAADNLPGGGRSGAPSPESQVFQQAIDGLSQSDLLAKAYQQKFNVPEGFLQGNFRSLSTAAESGYRGLGYTLTGLNQVKNLNEIRGRTMNSLKHLGPISFGKDLMDRTHKLLKARGDEPFLYKVCTVVEAGVVETGKTLLTKNPAVALVDHLIGHVMGQAPSEYIADASANFVPKYYTKWRDLQAPHSVSNLESTRTLLRELVQETQADFEAKVASGELSREEAERQLKGVIGGYRKDYVELSGKLIKHTTSFGD